MIIVTGTLTMPAENVAGATEAVVKVMEATKQEEGNIDYVFAEVIGSPGTILITEKWASEEALGAHFGAPHMAEFMQVSGGWGITGMEVLKFQADDGAPLM